MNACWVSDLLMVSIKKSTTFFGLYLKNSERKILAKNKFKIGSKLKPDRERKFVAFKRSDLNLKVSDVIYMVSKS